MENNNTMRIKTTLSYPSDSNNESYRFRKKTILWKITRTEKNQYKEEPIYMRGVLIRMKT